MLNQRQNQKRTTNNVTNDAKTQRGLAIIAMMGLLLVLLLLAYMSVGAVVLPVQTGNVQPSPPAGEGASQRQGQLQETRMRLRLRDEGYEQPRGESDVAIRQNLGLKANEGRVADFVGRNSVSRRWLIAESKGGDLEAAVQQLDNTAQHLWRTDPNASAMNTEFRIYTNVNQFNKLHIATENSQLGGYALQDGYLGYTNEAGQWIFETISGSRISVLVAF